MAIWGIWTLGEPSADYCYNRMDLYTHRGGFHIVPSQILDLEARIHGEPPDKKATLALQALPGSDFLKN